MTKTFKERLSEILVKNKLLSEEHLREALLAQRKKGGRLSKVLVEMGLVNEKDLMILLSEELNIPPIDLSRYKVDEEVANLIPKDIIRRYEIMPISKIGKTLSVAMVDPLDVFAIDDIRSLTGFEINPLITTSDSLREAVRNTYEAAGAGVEKITKEMEEAHAELLAEPSRKEVADTGELVRLTRETPVVKITNALVSEATKARASDILIEPLEDSLRIRYRVDGVLQETHAPPISMHPALVSRIKVLASLDISERRRPQDGRFKMKMQGRDVDFRVSILPSSFGERVAIRILDKSQATLDLDKLGFELQPLMDLKKCAQKPFGMILICGPAGCGKTTTLYAILKYVDTPEKNIVTVEDPIEYQLDGVNQVTARPDVGLTFASALRAILRQDPNIVMIGEIRDLETCDIAIKAALTGHLLLSTLHTTTAAGSITRLVNMGVEPFLITSSLICVGAQRLLRKICQKCREPYKISQTMKDELKIRIPGDATFYRARGCDACYGSGYAGRVGLLEVLVLNPEIRDLINNRARENLIFEAARRSGMKTLRENGLEKVMAGITTMDEVARVTTGDQY